MSRPKRSAQRLDYSELEDADGSFPGPGMLMGEQPIYPLDPFPTDQEVAEAQRAAKAGERRLIQLDLRRSRIISQLEAIKNDRQTVEKELVFPRSIVTRLRDIPQEILSMIFEACAEDADFSPWTVMQINRKWRSAALHSRTLWSKIRIFNKRSYVVGDAYSGRQYEGYELCDSPSRLHLALARSAGGPLDIIFDIWGSAFGPYWNGSDEKQRTTELVSCLKPVEGRIRTLDLLESSSPLFDELPFGDISLPLLESAFVHGRMQELLERIWTTAPNIWQLSYRFDLETKPTLNIPSGSRITDLRLHGGGHIRSDAAEVSEHLAQAITSATCLTHLTLTGLSIHASSAHTPLFLPILRHLKLVSVKLSRTLESPLLEFLHAGFTTIFQGDAEILTLPSLLSLTLDQLALAGFRDEKLHAPMLQELIINGAIFSPYVPLFLHFMDKSIKTGQAVPRKLVLHDCNTKGRMKEFIDAFHAIPLLEELALSKTMLTKSFFEAFAGGVLGTKFQPYRKSPICKSLKRFRLSLDGIGHRSTEHAMQTWAPKAVKARARRGYPLETARIQESGEEGWKSLL